METSLKKFRKGQGKVTIYGSKIITILILHFKQVHHQQPIYSVRVGLSYRALGIKQEETMIWFWIGSHEDYNKLIVQL
ncbi:MAG: hypothetical protein WKG06_19525 [Segetibacter sp.]